MAYVSVLMTFLHMHSHEIERQGFALQSLLKVIRSLGPCHRGQKACCDTLLLREVQHHPSFPLKSVM